MDNFDGFFYDKRSIFVERKKLIVKTNILLVFLQKNSLNFICFQITLRKNEEGKSSFFLTYIEIHLIVISESEN